jgi:hypothetical protein
MPGPEVNAFNPLRRAAAATVQMCLEKRQAHRPNIILNQRHCGRFWSDQIVDEFITLSLAR